MRRRFFLWLMTALLAVIAACGAGFFAERIAIDRLLEQAGPRRDIYIEGLRSELGRYETLPSIMTYSTTLRLMLSAPDNMSLQDRANRYLEQVASASGAAAIYAIDPDGTTRAASNWQGPASFVGLNFSFRPYFREAVSKGYGRFYGIGTTSKEPGYYFARGIKDGDRLLGVVVVKVSLAEIEHTWAGASDHILVMDGNGVTILSSVPDWTFRTLEPLSEELARRLAATRQYDRVQVRALDVRTLRDLGGDSHILAIGPGTVPPLLETGREVPGTGWRLMLLSDMSGVVMVKRIGWAAGAGMVLLLVLALLLARQRRRTRRLEREKRQDLLRAAEALERQVAERTAALVTANDDLRRTQEELVQAAKLAAIGQLATGVAHELNQPLAALRTLSDNAAAFLARGKPERVTENLTMIAGLTERMASITSQLRGFARRSDNRPQPVNVAAATGNALSLLAEKARRTDAAITVDIADDINVLCDPIRLEQVLVNLIGNAMDAVADRGTRTVKVDAARIGDRVRIRVADSGAGIADDHMPHLFEPFFTTKAPGLGLGLGLVISAGIIQDHGGSLSAANGPLGGAVFTIELAAHD